MKDHYILRTNMDPLKRVADNRRRLDLLWFRLNESQVITSANLRAHLPGFKGQQGIYKPSGAKHALWVRETLHGPYPDKPIETHADGSWAYDYTPEWRDGKPDLTLPTNKSLLRCMDEKVPVGVLRQTRALGKKTAYEVIGLALVEGYDGTHFQLRGDAIAPEEAPDEPIVRPFEMFDPPKLSSTVRKQRDSRFGIAVRRAYQDKCAACQIGFRIRGHSVGLEAAHIVPVEKNGTSTDVRNGMLLCGNHHALMDAYAWTLDEEWRVMIAPDKEFRETALPNHILAVEGHRIPNLPMSEEVWPDPAAIRFRLDDFHQAWSG